MNKKIHWTKLIISLTAPLAAGFLGSIFTTPAVRSWYLEINKPSWNPPNWLFGPVWTTLFILMGIALYLVWKSKVSSFRMVAVRLFWIQLVFNVLWSVFFFGLRNFWLAFVDIMILWILIAICAISFGKINKTAGVLLIPYLMWVSFASVLNLTIALIN